MSKASNPAKSDKLSKLLTPTRIKHQKVAELVVNGATYDEIAAKHYPTAKNPRQTIYSTLHNTGVQDAIREQLGIYTPEKLRQKAGKIITKISDSKPSSAAVRVMELEYRANGMLKDVSLTVTANIDVGSKALETLDMLRNSTQQAQGEPIYSETGE